MVLLVSVCVSVWGFSFCGTNRGVRGGFAFTETNRGVRESAETNRGVCADPLLPRRVYNPMDAFLCQVSCFGIILICISLMFSVYQFALVAFSLEIGYCVFELIRTMHGNRPVLIQTLMHHVCTFVAIQCSLLCVWVDWRILAQLSFAFFLSGGFVAGSKWIYTRNSRAKEISYWILLLYRLILPVPIIIYLLMNLLTERPPWARLYATSILLLWTLNAIMVRHARQVMYTC